MSVFSLLVIIAHRRFFDDEELAGGQTRAIQEDRGILM